MKYRIRIIHSPSDHEVATTVRQALEAAGFRYTDSVAGSETADEMSLSRKDKKHAMVLILSNAANDSPRINREVQRAADAAQAIITFRIDKAPLSKHLEFYLSTTHWLDASSPPIEKHLDELVRTVRQLIALRRPRSARKGKAAMVLGIVSIFVVPALGLVAIALGVLELRGIKKGRSLPSARKYAWIGVITGVIGSILWLILIFRWWYWGINPSQGFIDWLNSGN